MIRLLLRPLLPILAIVGLLLAPIAASAGPAAMTAGTMTAQATAAGPMSMSSDMAMPTDMSCCPHAKPAVPDCQKTCPLMALCSTALVQLGSIGSDGLPLPIAGKALFGWRSEAQLVSLSSSPPTRPPRA